ncbi:MAG: hypothetical protein GF419_14900 [Ignavibacteriales bacterium]|nr:hypothetical protein [Ignavibacteriales bacterium]
MTTQERYHETMRRRVEDMEKHIRKMFDRVGVMSSEMRVDRSQKIRELSNQTEALKKTLYNLNYASDDEWERFKKKAERLWEEITDADADVGSDDARYS